MKIKEKEARKFNYLKNKIERGIEYVKHKSVFLL